MVRVDRLPRGLLVLAVLLFAACTAPAEVGRNTPRSPVGATPSASPSRVGNDTTLGLRLFVDGRIIMVTDGREATVAQWPSATAPYEPPVEARHGFVGLTYAPRGQALWYVTAGGVRRLGSPVSQGFGVSALGRYVAFGETDLTSRRGSTRLVLLGGHGFERVQAETVLHDVHAAAGDFVGDDVFVGWGDGGAVSLGLWDPASGTVTNLPAYTGAGPADPVSRRVVLYQGDGGCWGITTWPRKVWPSRDRDADCAMRSKAFSPSGLWLAGVFGAGDGGYAGGPRNRVLIKDATDATTVFESPPIPGAIQVAWEDESRLLVLAREEGGGALVYRCDLDQRRCESVWALGGGTGWYSAWLVPIAPLGP